MELVITTSLDVPDFPSCSPRPLDRRYRSMPDNKVTLFIDALYKAPWSLVSAFTDTNDKWDTRKSIFMNVVGDHFPIRSHRRRKFTPLPWMNDSTIKLIRKRDFCRRASISSKRSLEERLLFEREYKQCRNRVKYSLRKAKAEYFRKTLTSLHSQPHRFWKVVNDLVGRGRERSPPSPSVVSIGREFGSVVGQLMKRLCSKLCLQTAGTMQVKIYFLLFQR